MNDNQIIRDIFGVKQHHISNYLIGWLSTCPKFRTFLTTHKDKIRSKIKRANTDEDLEDIRFELEVAYLFLLNLNNDIELEYEKYGTRNSRSPDFSIVFKQTLNFNVEVKRIRETDPGIRLKNILKVIEDRIRKIPSGLSVSINVRCLCHNKDFIDTLETSLEQLISYIRNTIKAEEHKLDYGALAEFSIPGFQDELILELSKPLSKYDKEHTSYHNGLMPIFYTQKEHYKFGDTVFEKLGQMLPDIANLLIIGSDSSTHEKEDLLKEIRIVNELVNQENDDFFIQKGFEGVKDFNTQMKNLSAILFRSIWINNSDQRNLLWINENANFELPKDIIKLLPIMD
ncbi:MAG: hypothetical protein FJ264_13510 [Planctomycetes bacterium]|nr:hypothetical protein [Planctomycetota bacterium]MBM4064144.1 hypothetical protein [Planctomycetota bacterium]